jgi:shikimate dehydrogenase
MPVVYGLIGHPLTHSFSPAWFQRKFERESVDAVYHPFPLKALDALPALLGNTPDLRGLNVTIPYKTAVIPYMDDLSAEAKAIGAVNCIDIREGKLTGYNTDTKAFEHSLNPLLKNHHQSALVLGTGGASLAVCHALKELGIDFKLVSRERSEHVIAYEELSQELIQWHKIIVNTTPLGMYPHVEAYPPIPYDLIDEEHLLYDLIYNPDETQFLSLGKAKGAAIKNGLEMLQLQAEASWNIWNR